MRKTPATHTGPAQQIASAVMLALGLLLMAIKIRADSEPGALPLALVVLGLAWHVLARMRRRARRRG